MQTCTETVPGTNWVWQKSSKADPESTNGCGVRPGQWPMLAYNLLSKHKAKVGSEITPTSVMKNWRIRQAKRVQKQSPASGETGV